MAHDDDVTRVVETSHLADRATAAQGSETKGTTAPLHSMLPWCAVADMRTAGGDVLHAIYSKGDDHNIAELAHIGDAYFIVTACNAHYDLLEALKRLFEDYKRLADSGDAGRWALEDTNVGKQALAAIQKAEAQ